VNNTEESRQITAFQMMYLYLRMTNLFLTHQISACMMIFHFLLMINALITHQITSAQMCLIPSILTQKNTNETRIKFICGICTKTFTNKKSLTQHY
ncbi:hypothetical protein L9F63_027555, partial [Diploptera punctata]